MEHVRPDDGETNDVRVTIPANPFTGAIVIVEAWLVPAFVPIWLGAAIIVKSWIVYEIVTEFDRLPVAPVTVRL